MHQCCVQLKLRRGSRSLCRSSRAFRFWGLWRSWQEAPCHPDLNERLHWLHLLLSDQVEQPTHVDEVDEARVKLLVGVDVPERIQPVTVINVSIAAHHLSVYALNVRLEVLRETRGLSEPVAPGQSGERCVEISRTRRDRSVCSGCRDSTRWICGWCLECDIDWKEIGIADFPVDPLLDQLNVLARWYLNWPLMIVQPSVRVARSRHCRTDVGIAYWDTRLLIWCPNNLDHTVE